MKNSKIYTLWQKLDRKNQRKFIYIFIFAIFVSFTDILTIASIFPFLAAIVTPDLLLEITFIQPLFTFLNINNEMELMFPLTVIFCSSVVLAALSRLSLMFFQILLTQQTGVLLKQNIYEKILLQPFKFHYQNNSGDLIAKVSQKTSEVVSKVIMPVFNILSSFIVGLSIIVTLLLLNPILTLVTFVFLTSLYFISIIIFKKHLLENSRIFSKAENNLMRNLQEGFGGIKDIIINNTHKNYLKVFLKNNLKLKNASIKINMIGIFPRYFIEALGLCTIAIIAYLSVSNFENSSYLIPSLGALALGAQRLLPLIQQAFKSWSDIQGNYARLLDVLELLALKIPQYSDHMQSSELVFNNKINLNNISFSYNKANKKILKNLNLEINKGDKLGIIGKTGSGKTTLINLIIGLLEPEDGEILIDGMKLNKKNTKDWMKQISHVPQNIYLSDNTIAQNISLEINEASIDKELLNSVSKKAQIFELIDSMEEKFNTIVGERGINISGGQLQRIGIARALYKKASIIILDEATSALDSDTENSIMEIVNNISSDLTFIIISHRNSTLKNCNKVIELIDAKIGKIYSNESRMSDSFE